MTPEFILKFAVSLIMIVFGIHQMLWPREWFEYIPKWLENLLPFKKETDMRLHAVGNLLIGLFFLSNLMPLTASWLTLIWWLTILPFAFRRNWSIGMRDLTIIFAIISHLMLVYGGF